MKINKNMPRENCCEWQKNNKIQKYLWYSEKKKLWENMNDKYAGARTYSAQQEYTIDKTLCKINMKKYWKENKKKQNKTQHKWASTRERRMNGTYIVFQNYSPYKIRQQQRWRQQLLFVMYVRAAISTPGSPCFLFTNRTFLFSSSSSSSFCSLCWCWIVIRISNMRTQLTRMRFEYDAAAKNVSFLKKIKTNLAATG